MDGVLVRSHDSSDPCVVEDDTEPRKADIVLNAIYSDSNANVVIASPRVLRAQAI